MRNPRPLPLSLQRTGFTRRMLVEAGFARDRVQRQDISALGSGVFMLREFRLTLRPEELHRHHAVAVVRDFPASRLSHVSAAVLWGIPLPWRTLRESAVHLTFDRGGHAKCVRRGVIGHRRRVRPGDQCQVEGVWISSPARTWAELASILSLSDLVIAGDHLLKRPWHPRGRGASLSSHAALAQQAQHLRGGWRAHALRALELVQVGADSPRETRFRLALLHAGLPEPVLQLPLDPADPYSWTLDMAYPQHRLGFQYDGGQHFTSARGMKDQRRDNAFTAAGWKVLKLNLLDDRENFRTSIAQVQRLVHR